MQVIIKNDVKGVGKRGEVKDFKDGYARNFLIARGLAVPMNRGNMAKLATLKAKADSETADRAAREAKLVADLEGRTLTTTRKANEQGGLFDTVSAKDVEKLLAATGVNDIQLAKVDLHTPLKHAGAHTVTLIIGSTKLELPLTITAE